MQPHIKKDVNYLQNLIEYAKRNVKKGYSPDALKWALINQGHSRIEVDKAMAAARAEISKETKATSAIGVNQPALQDAPSNIQLEPEPKESFWKRWFS